MKQKPNYEKKIHTLRKHARRAVWNYRCFGSYADIVQGAVSELADRYPLYGRGELTLAVLCAMELCKFLPEEMRMTAYWEQGQLVGRETEFWREITKERNQRSLNYNENQPTYHPSAKVRRLQVHTTLAVLCLLATIVQQLPQLQCVYGAQRVKHTLYVVRFREVRVSEVHKRRPPKRQRKASKNR